MDEVWKWVVGYEGLYQVSNLGSVRSTKKYKIRIVKLFKNEHGYVCVRLNNKKHFVHRLVGMAFIPNPDDLPFINHKDETRDNNVVSNLEWCTQAYNNTYGTVVQRQRNQKSTSKKIGKYSLNGELLDIFPSIHEAARIMKIDAMPISKCCNGKTKTSCGFRWRFL